MSSPAMERALSADAGAVPAADAAPFAPADQLDSNSAWEFLRQLDVVRRAARTQPALAARLLSDWMSRHG